MPFGLTVSPLVCQRVNTKIFGKTKAEMYLEDTIIPTNNEKEPDSLMEKVLDRARINNIKFNADKTQYKVDRVKYLGHIFRKMV